MPKAKKSRNENLRAYRKLLKRHRKFRYRQKEIKMAVGWERFCGPKVFLSSLSNLLFYVRDFLRVDEPFCDEDGNDLDNLTNEERQRILPLERSPVNAKEFVSSLNIVLRELRQYVLPRLWSFQLKTGRNPDGTVLSEDYLKRNVLSLPEFCERTKQPLGEGYFVPRNAMRFVELLEENASNLELEEFNEAATQSYLRRMKWELTFAIGWLQKEVMHIKDFEAFYEEMRRRS